MPPNFIRLLADIAVNRAALNPVQHSTSLVDVHAFRGLYDAQKQETSVKHAVPVALYFLLKSNAS